MGNSINIKDELRKEGYSREEEYFYRLNRELIEKRRKQREPERENQKSQQAPKKLPKPMKKIA